MAFRRDPRWNPENWANLPVYKAIPLSIRQVGLEAYIIYKKLQNSEGEERAILIEKAKSLVSGEFTVWPPLATVSLVCPLEDFLPEFQVQKILQPLRSSIGKTKQKFPVDISLVPETNGDQSGRNNLVITSTRRLTNSECLEHLRRITKEEIWRISGLKRILSSLVSAYKKFHKERTLPAPGKRQKTQFQGKLNK